MTVSLMEFCGLQEDSKCGYCKGRGKTSIGAENVSLGVWAHEMTPAAYLNLMDCGWRRSGAYVYKPIMDRTCCPQYTIRLDATKFAITKSQKRVLKRVTDYLKYDKKPKCKPVKEEASSEEVVAENKELSKSEASLSQSKDKHDRPVRKKKELRRERCIKKWIEKNVDVEDMQKKRREKEEARKSTLSSLVEEYNDTWKHKLEVLLVKPKSEIEQDRREECFALFQKYQAAIHNDHDGSLLSYVRFLVESPLNEHNLQSVNQERPAHGSYHQWYILDGKLIAVGIIDILPRCLSSKYVYYDPDYLFLNLGTYTALREIRYTQQLAIGRPELKYYYMGYYIQTCPKMRYKGKYHPSELLCDKSFNWYQLGFCVDKILKNGEKFVNFNDELAPRMNRNSLKVWLNGTIAPYGSIENLLVRSGTENNNELAEIREKLDLIAKYLAETCGELVFFIADIYKKFFPERS